MSSWCGTVAVNAGVALQLPCSSRVPWAMHAAHPLSAVDIYQPAKHNSIAGLCSMLARQGKLGLTVAATATVAANSAQASGPQHEHRWHGSGGILDLQFDLAVFRVVALRLQGFGLSASGGLIISVGSSVTLCWLCWLFRLACWLACLLRAGCASGASASGTSLAGWLAGWLACSVLGATALGSSLAGGCCCCYNTITSTTTTTTPTTSSSQARKLAIIGLGAEPVGLGVYLPA